ASRKQAIHDAFSRADRPYADAAFRSLERALDGYARAWAKMRGDACDAGAVRHEQSEELLELRMECLTRHLDAFRAQVDLFAGADPEVTEQAIDIAQSLPRLDDCANVRALRAPERPPPSGDATAALPE